MGHRIMSACIEEVELKMLEFGLAVTYHRFLICGSQNVWKKDWSRKSTQHLGREYLSYFNAAWFSSFFFLQSNNRPVGI
jgi:hypothetical protein